MKNLDEKIRNYKELEDLNNQELRNILFREDRYNLFCEVNDKHIGSREDSIIGSIFFIGSIPLFIVGHPITVFLGIVGFTLSSATLPFAIRDFRNTKKELRRFFPLNTISKKELKEYANKLTVEKERALREKRILDKWQDCLDKEVANAYVAHQNKTIVAEEVFEEKQCVEKPIQKVKKFEQR